MRKVLLSLGVAAALSAPLAVPAPAQAAERCPNGGQPDGRGRCVYQPAGMVCAWPARLVKVGTVVLCWRAGVQR